jgi:diguanylate cyclase
VASRFQDTAQKSDCLARLGGDEFAVMLTLERDPTEVATLAAQQLLTALEAPFTIEGTELLVQASMGIALFPDHGSDAASLMRQADVAMYTAKRANSGYSIYGESQDQHSPGLLSLLAELRQAIEHDHLMLQFQPQLNLPSGEARWAEALVRWQHPQKGLLQPYEFIPLAERTGYIRPLTIWVLDSALVQLATWAETGGRSKPFSSRLGGPSAAGVRRGAAPTTWRRGKPTQGGDPGTRACNRARAATGHPA